MALTRWPSPPDPRLLPWAIWRFRGEVPADRPEETPPKIPASWWEFLKWAAWRRKGAKPPRPDIAPKIPQWAWAHLRDLGIAVPLAPPPPPPPPPVPKPATSWNLPSPLVFTAWGWTTDSDFRNVEVIGRRMADAGVRTVALQIGQFPSDVPPRLRAFVQKIALWGEAGSQDAQALADAQADGYIPQIEGPYQYQNTLANLQAGVGRGLSISTVTTLAGLETYTSRADGTRTTVEVEELADAGCTHAWVECYTGNMDPLSVSKFMDSATRLRGLAHANPLIGLAHGHAMSAYMPDLDQYGRQAGVYLAEGMQTPRDWDDLRSL
jgi:hypothetical protein